MRIVLFLFWSLVFLGLFSGAARAHDQVGASLYLAQNNSPSLLSRQASDKLSGRLRKVFGFHHYVLLKSDKIELNQPWTQWFIPRHDFFICLKPNRPQADGRRLVDYEIYKDGFIVAKGQYEPSEGTPLFINGPDFKNGRLIFVLEPK